MEMRQLSGTARGVAFVEPSLIGRFFGNCAYLFTLDLGSELEVYAGHRARHVAVRHECFLRVPSFEGRTISVEGTFDADDKMFRGRRLTVDELRITIGAVRYLTMIQALVVVVLYPLLAAAVLWGLDWYYTMKNQYTTTFEDAAMLATLVALGIAGIYWLVILNRMALPRLNERLALGLRRLTEYR